MVFEQVHSHQIKETERLMLFNLTDVNIAS